VRYSRLLMIILFGFMRCWMLLKTVLITARIYLLQSGKQPVYL